LSRHAQKSRVEGGCDFAKEPFELDCFGAIYLFGDLHPGEVESRRCQQASIDEERVGVEDSNLGWVEVTGKPKFFEDDRTIVKAHGDTASVGSDFINDFHGDGSAMTKMPSEDDRIDARAQIIDVCDPNDLTAPLYESFEKTGSTKRIGQVTVAGGIDTRRTVGGVKQGAIRIEPQRKILAEGCKAVALEVRAKGFAQGAVSGVTGHQPKGDIPARALGPDEVFDQAKVQKALMVESVDESLDDTAHSGGHSPSQHDERELTAGEGLQAKS
jgi:hypothetical protein